MVIKCRSFFKKLPIYNKIVAIWFGITFAIPNKIFINNNVNKLVAVFSIFLIVAIAHIFPPFILYIYITFWVVILESYFFALFHEDSTSFRNFINDNLFNGNNEFAHKKEWCRF